MKATTTARRRSACVTAKVRSKIAQGLRAQRAVRRHGEGGAGERGSERPCHRLDGRARCEVRPDRGDAAVVPVELVDVAGQEDCALLGRVVVEDARDRKGARPAIGDEGDGGAVRGKPVAEGERLGHDHGSRPHRVPGSLRVALGEAVEPRVAGAARVGDAEVHLAERARHAHGAEGLDPRDARDRGHLRRHVRGDRREGARSAGRRRADEDVRPQREVEPVLDGRAEALDHQADADRDGDGHGQGRHRDAGAADRTGDGSRGETAQRAGEAAGDRRRQGHRADGGEGGQQGEAEDDREQAGEAREEGAPRDEEQQSPESGEDGAGGADPGQEAARAVFEGAAAQGLDGLDARGLEGGGHGRQHSGSQAENHGLHDGEGGEGRAGDGDDVVEVVDRLRDEAHGALAQQPAEPEAEERADGGGRSGLEQDEREDLPAGRAEQAQGADHRAPLHDAEHHGVVDEEHAHDEGQQAEGGEVQLEGVGELADRRGLLARRGDARALREERRDAGEVGVGRDEVDARDAVAEAEEPLRRADVHEHDRLERPPPLRRWRRARSRPPRASRCGPARAGAAGCRGRRP